MQHIHHTKQSGLTSVEMVVILTILPIILIIFSTIFINTSIESINSSTKTTLSIQARRALNFMEQSVRNSLEFSTAISSNYDDHFTSDGDPWHRGTPWSYQGSSENSRVLIISQYATQRSRGHSRLPVYKADSPYQCHYTYVSDGGIYNEKIRYMQIFFVNRENILYRRTLTDNISVPCHPQKQLQEQSCPPAYIESSACKTKIRDEVLATGVENFTIEYYDQDNKLINNVYSSPDTLKQADKIKVTLKLVDEKKKKITVSFSQMMTKGNQ